jgi:hypothetical protein
MALYRLDRDNRFGVAMISTIGFALTCIFTGLSARDFGGGRVRHRLVGEGIAPTRPKYPGSSRAVDTGAL